MSSLDKAFADFLKTLRDEQSYASLARKLGISESTLYRLTNGEQSPTLRAVESILQRLNLSPADIFGEEIHRKRDRRG
jgi:transcriptional regulator with XRE-family HTH domain